MKRAKISVIIPVYNAERFLENCLNSVLKQTFEDIEVICINDGSTDGSLSIMKRYEEKDRRVVVYSKNNGGAPSAWQYGLEHITGEYLTFLDADDWIEPSMYDVLYNNIERENADISIVGYYKDYNDRIEPMQNTDQIDAIITDTEQLFRYAFIRDRYRNFGAYMWNKLFRVEFIRNAGTEFDVTLARGADVLFFAKSAFACNRVVYKDSCLYHYTQWDASLTKTYSMEKGMGILSVYSWIINKGEDKGFSIDTIRFLKRFYAFHAGKLMEWALVQNDDNLVLKCSSFLNKYYDIYMLMNKNDEDRLNWMGNLLERNKTIKDELN